MLDFELVLQGVCDIFQKTFGVSIEQTENNRSAPIYKLVSNPNALNTVYFLLEISRKYRFTLSDDMMEYCTERSLEEITQKIVNVNN